MQYKEEMQNVFRRENRSGKTTERRRNANSTTGIVNIREEEEIIVALEMKIVLTKQ